MQQHVLALVGIELACIVITQRFSQAVAQRAQPGHRRPASMAFAGVHPGKRRPFFIAHPNGDLLAGMEADRVGVGGAVVAKQAGAHVSLQPPRGGRR